MIVTLLKRAGSAALLAATVAFGFSAAGAAPLTNPALSHAANSGSVMQVGDHRHYRGRGDWHRGGRHRYHNDGWNSGAYLGLGIAGAIIGGALSDDEGYYEGDGYYARGEGSGMGMGMRRCAAQFRSFEPETGYYTTYGGQKRLCPYLG